VTAAPYTTLENFLREVFACSTDTAMRIGKCAVDRRYPAHSVIIKQGDRVEATFLVAEGLAQALSYGHDGQVVLLHEYGRGDFFGAVADAAPEPEAADVVAVEELHAAVFRLLDFVGLVETHGCVARALTRMLLKELRTTRTRMTDRTILSATGRVHSELLRLARLGDGMSIRPVPVLANLAVHVQTTRETVSRAINALERRGIIRREPDALVIVAPHRLEELIV
jgi:CRP-like cAMP-binding protein